MSLTNDLFLRALLREPTERTPVWMMRQAGRYLPEYRRVRERAGSFMSLCSTPELACEVTLQPLDRFPLDAAILFSDILTVPDAMGLELSFHEGEGPRFAKPIRAAADVARLGIPDPERELAYVPAAVRLIKRELAGRLPLIGFAGSPWTLATYMVEGGGTRDFRLIKGLLFEHPDVLHHLLSVLADALAAYLNAQIAAGVDAVMIFDTWGGVLSHHHYLEYSLAYAARVQTQLHRTGSNGSRPIPTIFFTKGGGQWLEAMAASGFDALGLDWTTDIGAARGRVGDRVALQGNLDPMTLYGEPDTIRREVLRVLDGFGPGTGHVFNLGHGILPDVDPDRARIMIEAVHEFSPGLHIPR
ncbi:MAG: uroporphyrinogen decarboxylase [Methylotetracoccus sp.]